MLPVLVQSSIMCYHTKMNVKKKNTYTQLFSASSLPGICCPCISLHRIGSGKKKQVQQDFECEQSILCTNEEERDKEESKNDYPTIFIFLSIILEI